MFPLKLHTPAASEFVLCSLSLPVLLFEHVLITLLRCCGNAWEYWTCTLGPSWWVICLKSELITLSTKPVEKQSGRYDAGSGTEQSSNLVLEGKEKNHKFFLILWEKSYELHKNSGEVIYLALPAVDELIY